MSDTTDAAIDQLNAPKEMVVYAKDPILEFGAKAAKHIKRNEYMKMYMRKYRANQKTKKNVALAEATLNG